MDFWIDRPRTREARLLLRRQGDIEVTGDGTCHLARQGQQVAQSFERDPRDVLALPGEMARTITGRLDITLTQEEQARLASARPVDPEVHRQVLLGRYHAAKATEEGLRNAIKYFEAAIDNDPANALAQAGLAEAYTGLSGYYVDPREVMPKAKRAAENAIRLDDSLAGAHAALGFIHLVYDWDGPAAEKALLRALDLNPTLATARLSYAAYLTSQARNDEAVAEIRRAVEFDPLSIRTHSFGTLFLLFTRRFDLAIDLARRGLELEPNAAFALAFQGVAYASQGRFKEAVANMQRAEQQDNSLTILALEAHVLAVAGQKDAARTADSAGGRGGQTPILLPVRDWQCVCESWRHGHRQRMVSQGHQGTRRLHGMAWRRALD